MNRILFREFSKACKKVCLIRYHFILIIFLIQTIPTPSQTQPFPYSIKKYDYYLTAFSVGTFISGEYLFHRMRYNLHVEEIAELDRNTINAFDRPATYNWNTGLMTTSDVLAYTLPVIPATLMIPQIKLKAWENITTVGLMYLQVYGLSRGITNLSKSFLDRTRPYLYNDALTPGERYAFQGKEAHYASTSFFSGHATIAFASATFLSKMFSDIYGDSAWKYAVWGSSLAAASFTAWCRVGAGEHFTSDVIAGALVGSAIGYLVPLLHTQNYENAQIMVGPDGLVLSLIF